MDVQNVAKDFTQLCHIDMDTKLTPLNKNVDDMLARLEEFQTLISFVKQDRVDSTDILLSVVKDHKEDLNELCNRIDTMEVLMTHIKNNLNSLENDIEKKEQELGVTDNSIKVSNIFTPLFKKSTEKKIIEKDSEIFKTRDYFK